MARFRSQLLFAVVTLVLLVNSDFAADLVTPTATIPEAYFGLHIHHLDRPTPTPWPAIPVPEWRLWDADVTWPDLEPARGQWQFERFDRYISLAQKHGTGILLTLGGSPHWASVRPGIPTESQAGFSAEPNLEDWRDYVKTVSSRYKGRIQAYEIWNEPNLKQFYGGTTDQMVVLTKEASQIIHSVDAHAIVVSPSATANYGVPWFTEFLKKGGGEYVDVIGYHFYVNPQTLLPEDMVPVIEKVRQVISENGLGNKPLWNTETGWAPPAAIASDEVAAGYLARSYILSWAAGVQRFYWYAWDNRAMAIVTYKEDEHTITEAGRAYEVIERWLVGARMDSLTKNADQTWICQLTRSGKKEWIVWSPYANGKFDVPAAWHVSDVTPLLHDGYPLKAPSIEIGPAPMLLTGRS